MASAYWTAPALSSLARATADAISGSRSAGTMMGSPCWRIAARIARLSAWPSSRGLNAFTNTLASTVYLGCAAGFLRDGRRGAFRSAAIYRRVAESKRTPLTSGRNRRSRRRPARRNAFHAAVPSSSELRETSEPSMGRITPTARPRCVRMYEARASRTRRRIRAACVFNSRTPTVVVVPRCSVLIPEWFLM